MPRRGSSQTAAKNGRAAAPSKPRGAAKGLKSEAVREWLLLVYRVPSEPSNNRVSVWRELKRLGALYLQQCVCIVPALPICEEGVAAATTCSASGTSTRPSARRW